MGKKVKERKPRKQADPSSQLDNKSKKISKTPKVPSKSAAEEAETAEFPNLETDSNLQRIVEQTQLIETKEARSDDEEPAEPEPEPREKVKVKRKDALIKKAIAKADGYISISDPSMDNQVPKVPAFAPKKSRGIVYISHVPHGFFENQMKEFFSQFGTVTNIRLARSRKTGRSQGYAFIEFKYAEVAKVVSETMNNYLMFNKIMKFELLPKERMSQAVFANKVNPDMPPAVIKRRAAKKVLNSVKDEEVELKRKKKLDSKLKKKQMQLKAAGLDYSVEIS